MVDLVKIPIEQLREHPYGLTVMKPRTFAKLVRHIETTGWYEPLTVRRVAQSNELATYEVINGHSRLRALRRLQTRTALCLVSEMDDQEALLRLATLDRLRGVDAPERRTLVLEQLLTTMSVEDLMAILPDDRKSIERVQHLVSGDEVGPPTKPAPGEAAPPAIVSFMLERADAEAVDLAIDMVLRTSTDRPASRAKALALLAQSFLDQLRPGIAA